MYEITMISLDQSAAHVVRSIQASPSPVGGDLKYQVLKPLIDFLPAASFDAIITPGNSFGHMTGGFDGALVEYFGDGLDQQVRRAIEVDWLGELPVGNAIRIPITHCRVTKCLVYAPTMRVPKELAKNSDAPYTATLAAFQAIAQWNRSSRSINAKIRKILLPVMGMGTGLLPIAMVANQMQMALERAFAPSAVKDLGTDGVDIDDRIHRYFGA